MALNHTDIELQALNINNFKTISDYQSAKDGGLIDENDICFVEEQIYPDWNESDSGSPSYILNKPGLATSATSGFMSSEMVERILDFDEEEEVIAQSISLLDNKNPIFPLGHLNSSITSGSVSDLSIVFSGNLHNTQVITVDNGVESLNINVSNSGNIAQHSILVINPTENDVNVRVSSYNIVGDDMVVGNHIYDTFNAFITVYHKSYRNICPKAVSGTPGTLQVTMTPYTSSSAFTEWCNMIIMVDTNSFPSNISDLGDVSISDVTSGQTLVYNQVTNNWENGKPGAQVTLINWTIDQ